MPNDISTNLGRLQNANTAIGEAIDDYGFNLGTGSLTTYSTKLDTINNNINGALESCLGSGSEYEILKSKTILSNGTYNPSYDDAIGYNLVTVNVPISGGNGHKVIVTTLPNADVTLVNSVDSSITYSGTANSSGIAEVIGVIAGTYNVTATRDGALSDSTTITVSDYTVTESDFATITVTASTDCTITLTNGTITKTASYTGTAIMFYVSLGTWTVSTIIDETTIERIISLSTYTNQNVVLKTNTVWDDFRDLVRAGTASTTYPVGTVVYDNYGKNSQTGEDDITVEGTNATAFVIVAYDHHWDSDLGTASSGTYRHSCTLLELKLDYNICFDNSEAFICLTTALTANNKYYVKRSSTYYMFTPTTNVPVGGVLTFDGTSTSTVKAYSSPSSTTELFSVPTSSSSSGTSLGTLQDSATNTSTYGNLNSYYRALYGSNNYYQSGIRQLINATTPDNWWTPQTMFDRPSNTSQQGKLYTLNEDFVSVLASPDITCITNNVTNSETPSLDGTTFSQQTEYIVKDKMFLVSHTEVNLSATPTLGSAMSYYSTHSSNSDRIKYRKDNDSSGLWWLRTPHPGNANLVRYVLSDGSLSYDCAYNGAGLATACVIQ